MFIGEYKHTIDDKKRLSLPSRFRKALGKKVVVTPGLDTCLFVFTEKRWSAIADELSRGSFLSSDTRSFNRFMFGGATEASVDSLGRILIPEFLSTHAKLKGKAIVLGVQDRIEIWSEQSWRTYKQKVLRDANSLAERLSTVGAV